jgi:hypothetical protein
MPCALWLNVSCRSTFPGAGRFTAHWTGDNGVNWENLYMSIAGASNVTLGYYISTSDYLAAELRSCYSSPACNRASHGSPHSL